MSGMVGRMARAMALDSGENWDAKNFGETLSGDNPDEMRSHWLGLARTALASMRVPTEAMNMSGHSAFSTCSAAWPDVAGRIFSAMVDAALSEPEK